MDGHHPDRLLVGLGNGGLGDPGVLADLVLHPFHEGPQRVPTGGGKLPCVLNHEPVAAPLLAHAGVTDRHLHQHPVADEAVNERPDGTRQPVVVEAPQHGEGIPDRTLGTAGRICQVVEPTGAIVVDEQVDIAAAKGRGTEGGNRGHLVGGIVYGPEAVQQVADFLGLEDERRALQSIWDVMGLHAPLQGGQCRPPGHQDADVGETGGAVGFLTAAAGGFLVQHLPLLGDDLVQEGGDVRGFLLPDRADAGVGGLV